MLGYIQYFWTACGEMSVSLWMRLYGLFGHDEFTMGVYGAFLVSFIAFWAVSALFLLVDLTGKPAFILQYKVQEDQDVPGPSRELFKCISVVLFNQIIVGVPFGVIGYKLVRWRECSFGTDLPTLPRFILEFVVIILFEEIGFYYSHRLLHHPSLYKHIHKVHHEWTAPIGIVALYCHPIEQVLANLIPPLLGPLVMGSHNAVILVWVIIAETNAIITHSGYHLPFMSSPEAHDYHHLKFNCNYGTIGLLDKLHGTNDLFLKTKQHKRHFTCLSFTPVKDVIPDDKRK